MYRAASEQYRRQQAIAATTTATVADVWQRMGDDFDASWNRLAPDLLDVVDAGRRATVARALEYTPAVLAETGQFAPAFGALNPDAFLSSAPDGRDVASLYGEAVIGAKVSISGGASVDEALAQSGRWMQMTTLTLLADTRRDVYAVDMGQRPLLTGYVRMLNGPSCSRCIALAGKWFRWNEGFQRHPRCDCFHAPGAEDVVGDVMTDPYKAFHAMTDREQERAFGRSEARAIREGADLYRVVNQSVRKLPTANSAVERIYRTAGTRTNAVRMLREQGYILERGQVRVALSPGVRTDAQIIAAGRGRGAVTLAGQRVTTNRAARFDAVAAGERDVLRRSTMTAAERRLYDAHYRLQYARTRGTVPRSIGPSSADRFANTIEATPKRVADLERDLAREVRKLREKGTPDSVRRLARALGLM